MIDLSYNLVQSTHGVDALEGHKLQELILQAVH